MKKALSFLLVLIFVFSALVPAALAEEGRDEELTLAISRLFPAEGSHDPAAVLELLLPLAEQGNADAMCSLGHMYRDGIYVEQDYNTAMDYFIDASVLGNISAPYVVEMMKAANEGMERYHEREDEYLAAVAG